MLVIGKFSNGDEVQIKDEQVWRDDIDSKQDIVIVEATKSWITYRYIGEKFNRAYPPFGSNGFIDFLETCGYKLKK